jgi:hypothetical protein
MIKFSVSREVTRLDPLAEVEGMFSEYDELLEPLNCNTWILIPEEGSMN